MERKLIGRRIAITGAASGIGRAIGELFGQHGAKLALLDRKWLLWRERDGGWAMIEDRCPHRFVPLSRGTFHDGRIACGYHGLTFDGTGACVHNPFGGELPPTGISQVLLPRIPSPG